MTRKSIFRCTPNVANFSVIDNCDKSGKKNVPLSQGSRTERSLQCLALVSYFYRNNLKTDQTQ